MSRSLLASASIGCSLPRARIKRLRSAKPSHGIGARKLQWGRKIRHDKARCKSDIPPFRTPTATSKAAVAPLMRHPAKTHSHRQRIAPATFGSNTSIRLAPNPGYPRSGAQSEPLQNVHCRRNLTSFGVKPRRVRISASRVEMMSMTRPKCDFCANARPSSA